MKNLELPSTYLSNLSQHNFLKDYFFILGYFPNEFLQKRTQHYLIKLSKARFTMNDLVSKSDDIQDKAERTIFLKFLAVKFLDEPFQRKVLGILIGFNYISKYEKFEYSHLLTILKKIIPGIHILQESFYLLPKNERLFCYCEIEKIRGKNFNLQECFKLKKQLSKEIKDGIEFLSPHLFIFKNEEETLKNILRLNNEVTSIKDLPHISISFEGQFSNAIRFIVILARIRNAKTPSMKNKLANLHMRTEFHAERIDVFKKNYVKELFVFSVELSNSLFYRKNYAIDLLKARNYLCMILEQNIGEFRDYNGGLLSKQTEQFDLLKRNLTKHIEDTSDFETIFYSLAPSNIQLLISSEMAIEICSAFYKLKNEKTKNPYNIKSAKINGMFFVIIKTTSSLYNSIFSDLPETLLVANTTQIIDQQKYHCLVQIAPSDLTLLECLHEKLLNLKNNPKSLMRKKEIRINFQEGAPPSFHPHLNGDIKTFTVCKAIYEGLTRIDPNGEIQPATAAKIEISDCRKKYTFILRETKWSNGEKVTSYDFAKAWKRVIKSRLDGSNCVVAKDFSLFKNANFADKGDYPIDKVGIYTPSEEKIIIELENPFPYFLHLLANPSFSPIYGENLANEPKIFNGPFIPTILDKKIKLTRNEHYWDKESVKIEKINIFLINDSNKAFEMYQNNDLDWIGSPFSLLTHKIQQDAKSIQFYETNSPFWLFCNTQNPKLKSAKIRQALSYAIDREKLIEQELLFQKPLYSIIPQNLSYLSSTNFHNKNLLKKAPILFEEAMREEKLHNFEIKLNHSNLEDHIKIAHFLKVSWEENLPIKVTLVENSWNTHWNTFFRPEFEIGGGHLLIEYSHALYFMRRFENIHNNFSRWESKEYEIALSKAKRKFQTTSLKAAESILMKELPVIPVCIKTHGFYMGNLKNFILPTNGYADFKWISYD